jgi:hypothetical protein
MFVCKFFFIFKKKFNYKMFQAHVGKYTIMHKHIGI